MKSKSIDEHEKIKKNLNPRELKYFGYAVKYLGRDEVAHKQF